ncbi:type I toxin-antitoxin system SymE family toxin [Yokenella regensburgei]
MLRDTGSGALCDIILLRIVTVRSPPAVEGFHRTRLACYSQRPGLHFKSDWLAEAGFDTGRGVTVRISQGCIVLIADCDEVQALREQLYQVLEGG